MHELTVRRKVEFSDTDMAGIVHFSRLIVFMENAEHAFFEALGASVSMEHDGKHIGWPRVAVEAQFKAPARFNEHVEITVRVLKKGTRSMTYGFEIRVGARLVGTGEMTSVCCEMTGKGPRSMPIPAFLADQIEEAPSAEEA
ncbi:MAG: acyl-CoA thioesterase [Acidobacteria bacterium]|nr:acyl-CoA thioesterase [Acidobacteriota bacterium]